MCLCHSTRILFIGRNIEHSLCESFISVLYVLFYISLVFTSSFWICIFYLFLYNGRKPYFFVKTSRITLQIICLASVSAQPYTTVSIPTVPWQFYFYWWGVLVKSILGKALPRSTPCTLVASILSTRLIWTKYALCCHLRAPQRVHPRYFTDEMSMTSCIRFLALVSIWF